MKLNCRRRSPGVSSSIDGCQPLSAEDQPVGAQASPVTTVPSPFIVHGDDGVARLAGTAIKVADIVADFVVWQHTPNQILENYPQLTPAQIQAASTYYADHGAEVDAYLLDEERETIALRTVHPNPISRAELVRRRRARRAPIPAR